MAGDKKTEQEPFYAPFRNLEGLLRRLRTCMKPPQTAIPECPSELQLFQEAMRDVIPLDSAEERYVYLNPSPVKRNWCVCPESVEVMGNLVNLVRGDSDFDLCQSDEYMQWIAPYLNPTILEHLRQGRFPIQGHIDLHHMSVEEARAAVSRFTWKSYVDGLGCVLVVHGKGLNSANRTPVLKRHLENWLRRGRIRKVVRAYASARAHDGGLGALYVLLEPSRKFLTRPRSDSRLLVRRKQEYC
jgi:DNA-nicking Smr family endonuclease